MHDRGGRLRGKQPQHLLVRGAELGRVLLAGQEEIADLDAAVAHRRALQGLPARQLVAVAAHAKPVGQAGEPERARHVAEIGEQPGPVGPLGDLAPVKWEHVHGDRAVLPDGKTGPRTIRLASPARAVLAARPRCADCPWVFASPCGAPANPDKAWHAVRAAAGLPQLRIHDLRHSHAAVAVTDAASGLSIEAKARMLVAHADSDYEEWSASATARLDPGERGRGLSVSLAPTIGATSSASDRLWGAHDARALAPDGGTFRPGRGLAAEMGYGLALFGDRFTGTPNIGFGMSDGGARDYRIGWRMTSAVEGDPGFEVRLDATRREAANDDGPPEHGVMLRSLIRW